MASRTSLQGRWGYPSLLVTASAMAARTSKLIIGASMYLLPLYHPVQTAEDIAILNTIADGRVRRNKGIGEVFLCVC
ncbi:MAG: LLM class flavin-dependent oxidoreductase [Candidatus Binatia bacterium]